MEIVIKNGTIIDGTGECGFRGDVRVSGELISQIGDVAGDASLVIDASGMVVSPGFVDMHAHSDFALVNHPEAAEKIMQGVTTNVIGNCGLSPAPANDKVRQYFGYILKYVLGETNVECYDTLADYLDKLENVGVSTNIATLAAHGTIKCAVTEMSPDPPDEDELERMKERLRRAMEEGAFGLSTGLVYPPGAFAKTDELIELCKVVAEYGGIYSTHIRDEANRLVESIEEAIEIGRSSGARVHISHHKAFGMANWGKSRQSLDLIDQARKEGLDITADQHPYTASSTLMAPVMGSDRFNPENVMIASTKYDRSIEGRMLRDIARERGITPAEAAEEINSDEDGAVVAIFFEMDEDDIIRIMKHPSTMIGSDGIETETGKPHPRLYGTFPRVLAHFVRDMGVLSLEAAVNKMTFMAFDKLGLEKRGLLKEGYFADVVIFDPKTIADTATYEEPRQYPTGIRDVLVNGEITVHNGEHTGVRRGKVLRRRDS